MKLEPDEDTYFYNFAAGVWGHDKVNTTFTVVSNEMLITCCTDVSSKTAGIEDMIRLHAPERKSGKATKAKCKPDHKRESSNHIIQAPQTAVANTSPCCRSSSPILVVSSPSSPAPPSPSRSSLPFPLTLLPCSQSSLVIDLTGSESQPHSPDVLVKSEPIDVANSVANTDQLWESGCIYVPQGCGSWPRGIYTRDMAFAFKKIFSSQGSDDEVTDRFCHVFPNITYVKATLYRQRTFWVDSTQSEHNVGENMARDSDGLWSKWRAASSGHKKFKMKKVKSG
ncbi:hypothetical protein K438DRAFT_1847616 [Mycena galopus ATCC 62051]|nr:hypothetical protein K438DRAFT_1847616 [Mycena galopus ATCC 62051]